MTDFATFMSELAGIASTPALWLSIGAVLGIVRLVAPRPGHRTSN